MSLSAQPMLGATTKKFADASFVGAVEAARRQWDEHRFAEVSDTIDSEWLRNEAAILWRELRPISEPVVRQPRVTGEVFLEGMRYRRVDPGRPKIPAAVRQRMDRAYEQLGLHEWGAQLSAQVEPIVSAVLGDSVTYDRVYFLLYEAGDYIGPHNDVQTGPRVNVQFPVAVGAITGLRVLETTWRTYYDTAGLLRILGPEVWHAVPPLMGAPDAYRLNISLRYWLRK